MAVTSTSQDVYTHFTDKEDELIKKWLSKQGYKYLRNTVCGNCCGMFEDEYWINGVGGDFPKKKQKEFIEYAKENNIGCKVYWNTIQAYDGEAIELIEENEDD